MECKCLEIISERMAEIGNKTTPMESMDEKDFFEIQALLKIHKKISDFRQSMGESCGK